eukprot:498522_1
MQLSFVLSLVVVCVVLPKSGMSALLDPCEPFFQEPNRSDNDFVDAPSRVNLVAMLRDADYPTTTPRFERIVDTVDQKTELYELRCSDKSCRMGCSDGYHIEMADADGTIQKPDDFQIICSSDIFYAWVYGNTTPDPVAFPASTDQLNYNPQLPRCVAHCSLVDLKRDLGSLNLGFANEPRGDIERMFTDDDYYITVSDPTKYRFEHDLNGPIIAFCDRSSSDKPVWRFALCGEVFQLSAFPPVVELTDQDRKETQDLAQQQDALAKKHRLFGEDLAQQQDLGQQQEALSTKNRPVEEERLAKQREKQQKQQHALAKK